MACVDDLELLGNSSALRCAAESCNRACWTATSRTGGGHARSMSRSLLRFNATRSMYLQASTQARPVSSTTIHGLYAQARKVHTVAHRWATACGRRGVGVQHAMGPALTDC